MRSSVEIVISSTGEVRIEAIGFKGADCEKATAYLEEALGVCIKRQRKPEYHQTRTRRTTQRIEQ